MAELKRIKDQNLVLEGELGSFHLAGIYKLLKNLFTTQAQLAETRIEIVGWE